jgi:hypothetical protein
VKIYDIRDRCYKDSLEEYKKIWVFRIICKDMKKYRKTTGDKVQYTLTILPEFLFPHSRIPIHKLLHAIEYYVKTDNSNFLEAAILIHCINPLSFRLYYLRFLKVLDNWIMLLVVLTLVMGGTINQEELSEPTVDIRQRMDTYEKYTKTYFYRHAQMPGSLLITDEQGYLHTLYCRNGMSLGP